MTQGVYIAESDIPGMLTARQIAATLAQHLQDRGYEERAATLHAYALTLDELLEAVIEKLAASQPSKEDSDAKAKTH